MAEEKWYHGRMTRQKAEELVIQGGIDGSFVVRASESILGAYALSVLSGGQIHTYRILPTDSGLLAVQTINGVQQRKFTSLTDLIVAYRNPQNGLACGLTNPVGPSSDKPSLAPPPAVAAPIPVHDPLRTIPPVPSSAFSASTIAPQPAPSVSRTGVKVMMDAAFSSQKQKQVLPPLPPPGREAPRPSITASQSSVTQHSSDQMSSADVKVKLQNRLLEISNNCPQISSSFMESLKQYCSDALQQDIESAMKGGGYCVEMQKFIAKEAGHLERELEFFLMKLNILRQLFDLQTPVKSGLNGAMRSDPDVDLESFLDRLGGCKTLIKSLNKTACINIKEVAGVITKTSPSAARKVSMKNSLSIPEYNFEVKGESAMGLKPSRINLRVNVQQGVLQIMKGDGILEFSCNQVLQIIKNNKSHSKLNIVYEGGKKREYMFEESSQREAFCQVMQLVKNMHSNNTEPDCVSLFVGTWNMGDAIPPSDIKSWFRCSGTGRTLDRTVCEIPHDIYAIGTQETGLPEKEWLHKVINTITEVTEENMHVVAMDALWHIKIIILVKEEHKNRISHVQTSSVKTGIANTLGNKGAVAVAFQFGGTSLCFINAHLTSGNEKCGRRNQNYHDIMRSLNVGQDRCSMFDITNRFDHLFFTGDLNYRLEMDVQEILGLIKKRDYPTLYKVDQLRREKELKKVFYGFNEEEVTFPPTYRYERGTRETYSHLKIKRTGIRINVPSWCDRLLWKSYPETHNICSAYGCCDDIMTSDHSPVFCNIQIGVRGQYVSNEGLKSSSSAPSSAATIIFESIEAFVKSSGRNSFYLQFHSTCLSASEKSSKNTRYDCSEASSGGNYVRVAWDRDSIPQLKPIISDREYLVDQHLLVILKTEEDNEYHAEFVLALRSMIGTTPQKFDEYLTRKGDESGQIRGSMHVKTRDSSSNRKEKTYEFIQFGVGIRDEAVPESSVYSDVNDNMPLWKHSVSTSPQKQVVTGAMPALPRPRTSIDFRPPLATPVSVPQTAPTNSGNQALSSIYADPDMIQRTSVPFVETVNLKKNAEMSPVFPARFPQNHRDDVDTMSARTKIPPIPPVPSALEAVIAEFEAAGSLFESMNQLEDNANTFEPVREVPAKSHQRQIYDSNPSTIHIGKVAQTGAMFGSANKEVRRAMPPPGVPPPRLPGSSSVVQKYQPSPPNSAVEQSNSMFVQPLSHNIAPPPPKARTTSMRNYSVKVPGSSFSITSVNNLLTRLGLSQYTSALEENGWDGLEFLSDVTDEDLLDCGIINEEHRNSILGYVENMNFF